MNQLVSKTQIEGNLRRTTKKGIISLLNQEELEKLAIKYYGEIDKKGNLIRYYCPYSGKPIIDGNKIVLEHIIPVTSNGGTVLFNCIPTSEEVNKSNEKGALHLLYWWKQKDYYSPEKLDKLLSYIFEAYDIVFKNNTLEEIKHSYDDVNLSEEEINKEADETTTSSKERKKLQEQAQMTGVISYLGFINDCISELKENNYDTSKYEMKLKGYENQGIFKEVERYALFQNILKETIKYKLNEDNHSELTYILNINISKLMNSMKEYQSPEEITREILNRINNIENILNNNNVGIISFFEDIRNHDILYQSRTDISDLDISKLINEINLSTRDKFNKMCNFYESSNNFQTNSQNGVNIDYRVRSFRRNITKIKKIGKFEAQLSKEQLKYLHDSEYESLREIYIVILNKAVKNNIDIAYVNEDMKRKIIEFYRKNTDNLTIEEQIKLELEYKDVIITESLFNQFINFVIINNGRLPKTNSKSQHEKTLGNFKIRIYQGKLNTKFNKEQLEYLHNSEYESLREIYKVILNKAVKNNIDIAYVDEDMKRKLTEFYQKKPDSLTIEEQIKLELEYKDVIIIESQFNQFINFVILNEGKLPSVEKNTEVEKTLGRFRNSIQTTQQNGQFNTQLNREQLEFLHNSEYESLREIYKVILNKAVKNNIDIAYVDKDMKRKLTEFYQKNTDNLTIEEQIKLEFEYKDVIIIESQFNQFINFVKTNNATLPSHSGSTENEKRLGRFKGAIQTVQQNGQFNTQLNREQLEYLHNSEYESLREIYKVILNKAVKNNIDIAYVDEDMKRKLTEFYQKNTDNLTIEEQIKLEFEYKDVIIIESQFNQFINFIIINNGKLPSQTGKRETERKLGKFRAKIQELRANKQFHTQLSREQLKYLHNSEYVELQELYNKIMEKAYNVNYQKYIEIDYEIRKNNTKGRTS